MEMHAAGRFARGLVLAMAIGSGTALFAQTAQAPPPVDVVTLHNATPTMPTVPPAQPAAPVLAKDPLDALPTMLFKMGNSAYTGHAPLGYNIGTPTVNRTADEFTLTTKIGPITIEPDATNPNIVDIVTNKATYQGTLQPTADGKGAVAQTLNKKKTITFEPGKSAGEVDIDMKGYVPLLTLHVTLLPVSLKLSVTLLLLGFLAQPLWAGPAQEWLTARGTPCRLSHQASIPFQAMAQPPESLATVVVDTRRTGTQTMEGIGGALTDAAAETWALPAAKQAEVIRAYFDPERGIGYTLARTHINSCDFSSESYAYDAVPGDTALEHFSIEHDRRYRIPFIKRILETLPALRIFASPWSPPAWMKTNNDMRHGGSLKPEDRAAWAQYYVKFLQAWRAAGIPIWGLTVQNEPLASQTWESCIYTADDERDFVKGFLGPALQGTDVHLMIWDHNRGLMYQRASAILSDPDAARYVWGTAFHWYVTDDFENVGRVHEAFPDKALLFSEGCHGPFDSKALDDWKWGEIYARSMIEDFNHWTCGWTDWNVLLDERGGPNHVGNYCFAPIIADTRKGTLHYMNSYWYIGHFSKFVRPGARRVACTVSNDDLRATAFVNPDGRAVAVVLNDTSNPQDLGLWSAGQVARSTLPAHAIATFTWDVSKVAAKR